MEENLLLNLLLYLLLFLSNKYVKNVVTRNSEKYEEEVNFSRDISQDAD